MPTPRLLQHRRRLTAADLEASGQLDRCVLSADGIALEDMVLVEDDAPAIGRPQGAEDEAWFEHLKQGLVVRKELILDRADSRGAWLLFCGREATGNDQPLYLRVNGHDLVRPPTQIAHPAARHYYTTDWGGAHFDNWFVVPIPPGALKTGANEILLWADSEEVCWQLMVAAAAEYPRGSDQRQKAPGRSARSLDGGQTWDRQHLGHKGSLDGEYCIRLSLDRHAHLGRYRSPVIDMTGDDGPFKDHAEVLSCRLQWDLELAAGTRVGLRLRSGPSPRPDADGWEPFTAIAGHAHTLQRPAGRYLQFEAELATDHPLQSPVLKGLHIDTEAVHRPLDRPAHLTARRNGRVVRPSKDFVHEDFARLRPLRETFELDRLVEGAASEFAAQLRLMRWAYTVPIGRLDPYAWDYFDLPHAVRDADGRLTQLGPYDRRRREGHCLYCNLTLIAACLSLGYPARWVNVSTKHTYGHEVAEVWSNEFDKWIMLDATRDYYLFDPATGIPLGLTEISQRLGAVLPAPATWDFPIQHWLPDGVQAAQMDVAAPHGGHRFPVFDPQVGSEDLILMGHLQMPLRNDFASRPTPVPWRLSSNWGSDQFYCWYSDDFPRKREYADHSSRWQDFSAPLNQAQCFVHQTDVAGLLRVEVDTQTPCFDCFMIQTDAAPWQTRADAAWDWQLHPGLNRLQVRVRNQAGVCGPVSHFEAVWND